MDKSNNKFNKKKIAKKKSRRKKQVYAASWKAW